MVRITEELVRKRAEHNEGEICSLEELALHQQDIEKILYLQNNLISRIENINRLKELEYLNLALNNIEIIENLEGNPCTDYAGYREYVIATLPQLKILDGEEIGKAERITAFQNLSKHYKSILNSQEEYFHRRAHEKVQAQQRKERFSEKLKENNGDIGKIAEEFWQEKGPYTPESRSETYEFLRLQKEQESKKTTSYEKTKPRRKVFFAEDGRPYNINEPKVEFKFYEEIKGNEQYFVLDVAAYRNMDTTLIDCDVQTNYVRVTLRNKVFQMALPEEVHPDKSSVQRSRVTGRLLVRMPKVRASSMIEPRIVQANHTAGCIEKTESKEKGKERKSNFLTVGETKASVDWRNITNTGDSHLRDLEMAKRAPVNRRKERKNSPSFVDNPDVPPLE
ncbi:Protein tilB -like protein [Echinococcus granulosus]|nr:Protein tilB -like protein [Echinococcus granulosus]